MIHYSRILSNPKGWFGNHPYEDSLPLWRPAVIVLAIALVGVIPSYLLSDAMTIEGEQAVPETILMVGQLFGLLIGIVMMFATWLLFAGIMHAVAAVIGDAHGGFRSTFYYVGWGYLPALFGSIFDAGATWYALQQLQVESIPVEELESTMYSTAAMQVSAGLDVLFILWTGLIWVFAVQKARNVTIQTAAIAVAIPVLIRLGFTISGLI